LAIVICNCQNTRNATQNSEDKDNDNTIKTTFCTAAVLYSVSQVQ